MENTGRGSNNHSELFDDWNRAASEELALIYLEDYYRTMDDSFLQESLQIMKDERLDFQKIMHRARLRMA